MRHDIEGVGIVFSHVPRLRPHFQWPRTVWRKDYANGWSRHSVMDYRGSVLYTRWIPPEHLTWRPKL